MASTKIQNLPLKAPIGAMKIPTGGFGDYSITVSSIGDFIIDTFNLATKDYVDDLKGISGTTTDRLLLENVSTGFYFWDSDLNKPVWYNGENWTDANGIIV